MEITLREARRSDFDALWKIDQQCFAPGVAYSRVELGTYMRRNSAFTLIAEIVSSSDEDLPPGIMGFVVAEAPRRRSGHIITIDVLPIARRSGAGSKLLHAAEERIRAAGCPNVVLEAATDNLGALAFYKHHGYSIVKTLPRYYSNRRDAFMLQKEFGAFA